MLNPSGQYTEEGGLLAKTQMAAPAPTCKRRCSTLTGRTQEDSSTEESPAARVDKPRSAGRQPSARLKARREVVHASLALGIHSSSLSPTARVSCYRKDDFLYESKSPTKRRRSAGEAAAALEGEEAPEQSPLAHLKGNKRLKGNYADHLSADIVSVEDGEKENVHTCLRTTGSLSPKTSSSSPKFTLTHAQSACGAPHTDASSLNPGAGTNGGKSFASAAAAVSPPTLSAAEGVAGVGDGGWQRMLAEFALFDPATNGSSVNALGDWLLHSYGAYLGAVGGLVPHLPQLLANANTQLLANAALANAAHPRAHLELTMQGAHLRTLPPATATGNATLGHSAYAGVLAASWVGGFGAHIGGAGGQEEAAAPRSGGMMPQVRTPATACGKKTAAGSAAKKVDMGVHGKVKVVLTAEERKKHKLKRQQEVLHSIGPGNVTEKSILDRVGDSRYTREILRRLLAQGVVIRVGKGGSNDPFLYTVVEAMVSEDGNIISSANLVDPGLEVRLKRIETKILTVLASLLSSNLLSSNGSHFTTEKYIRTQVGDNTGTGKSLRRLVVSGRVVREGKGGVGDPFHYCYGSDMPTEPRALPATVICVTPAAVATAANAVAKRLLTQSAAAGKGAAFDNKSGGRQAGAAHVDNKAKQSRRKTSHAVAPEVLTPVGAQRNGKHRRTSATSSRAGMVGAEACHSRNPEPLVALMLKPPLDCRQGAVGMSIGVGTHACTLAPNPNNPMNMAVKEEEPSAPDATTVLAVAPFTPKWARKYRTSSAEGAGSGGCGSGAATAGTHDWTRNESDSSSSPPLDEGAMARGVPSADHGSTSLKGGRCSALMVACGDEEEHLECHDCSTGGGGTPSLLLKLGETSPVKAGGWLGGGYLGADDEDCAAEAENRAQIEERDLSDALGLGTDLKELVAGGVVVCCSAVAVCFRDLFLWV